MKCQDQFMYPKKSLELFRICKVKSVFKNSLQTNEVKCFQVYPTFQYIIYIHTYIKIELMKFSNNNLDLHFNKRCFQSVGRGPFCPNLLQLLLHFGVFLKDKPCVP